MKKTQQTRFSWTLLALAALASSASGCKSTGFTMPGKNMFSWNRTPDANTLAGNTKSPNLPESPAAKYDPTAIASVGGKATSPATAGSAYGYGATGSGTTQPGLAATANGYQTGPYGLAIKATPPATNVASTATTGALPSPYGGSYNGTPSGLNTPSTAAPKMDIPLPNSVASALGKGAVSAESIASSATPGGSLPAFPNAAIAPQLPGTAALPVGYNANAQTPASTSAFQLPSSPTASSIPSFPTGGQNTITPVTTVGSTAGLPAFPGASSTTMAAQGSASGNQVTSNPAPASAYHGSTTLSPYSPGTTGRPTAYDFSSGKAEASPSAGTPPGGNSTLLR